MSNYFTVTPVSNIDELLDIMKGTHMKEVEEEGNVFFVPNA